MSERRKTGKKGDPLEALIRKRFPERARRFAGGFNPPDLSRSYVVIPSTPSETAVEEALAVLWKEVLGVPRTGRHDNFFESGGHSMLAMQLVARVRKRFNVVLPLRNIFEHQTLAGLAEIIERLSWSDFSKAPRVGEREVVDV